MKELSRTILRFMSTKVNFKDLPMRMLKELLSEARKSFRRLLETKGLLTGEVGRQRARKWADRIDGQLPETALECSSTQRLTSMYGFDLTAVEIVSTNILHCFLTHSTNVYRVHIIFRSKQRNR